MKSNYGYDDDRGTQNKLEVLRRIYCLGIGDIENIFGSDEWLIKKYENCRESLSGGYGNFKFIFDLDLEHSERVFSYLGFRGIDLGEKLKSQAVRFIKE